MQAEQRSSNLKEKLEKLSVQPQHTIFRVYDELRNINCKAYEPYLIAIGPYHSDKHNLKKMEIHKLRYMRSFLKQEDKRIEDCVSIIEGLELEVRKCYAEPVTLDSNKFIDMLVLDGCFIIEFHLQIKDESRREKYDPVFSMDWVLSYFKRDLMLFENQIPLLVISELFNLINGPNEYGDLSTLLLSPHRFTDNDDPISTGTKHLLELVHKMWIRTYEDNLELHDILMPMIQFLEKGKRRTRREDFMSSATRLAECNVKFKRFDKALSLFQIVFENGVMCLPRWEISDDTEYYFRNLIAYEQYFEVGKKCYVTDYAVLMDGLINSAEDVKLLIKCGIIRNCLGSEEYISDMLNKLTKCVTFDYESSIHKWQMENVVEHCNRRENAWMATLKQNHLNSPWAIIPIIAASLLIILTIVQTVFSVVK